MPKITLENFGRGLPSKIKLGTVKLNRVGEGYLGYGQNICVGNDEYGHYLMPGFSQQTIGGATSIDASTGPAIASAFDGQNNVLWLATGASGNKNRLLAIENIASGSTPAMATDMGAGSNQVELTVAHTTHTNQVIHDIINYGGNIYIVGKDDTENWYTLFTSTDPTGQAGPSTFYTFGSGSAYIHTWFIGDDDTLYLSKFPNAVASVSGATMSGTLVSLKSKYNISGMYKYGNYMAIAYVADGGDAITDTTLGKRNNKGSSGIALWNYFDTTIEEYIPLNDFPYISAGINLPSGALIVFAGRRDDKTTIFSFNGSGFTKLFEYSGDMPRNRHSVCLDEDERLVWQTMDGYILRYNLQTGVFEHLGTGSVTTDAGFISSLISGIEYVGSVNAGNTGINFIYDGVYAGGTTESNLSPIALTNNYSLPTYSKIQKVTIHLKEALVSGDKIGVYILKDGSTTNNTVGTLDFSVDGAISFKEFNVALDNVKSFAVKLVWLSADDRATAPVIEKIEIDWGK